MNKKLGRLLHFNTGFYFVILAVFAIIAAAMGQYLLALTQFGITGLLLVGYLLYQTYRRKELQAFIQKMTDEGGTTSGTEAPFPMLVVQMSDGRIVHANDRFVKLSGFQDTMTQRFAQSVIADFDLDWLAAGKTECPYDITLGGRRHRVYATTIHTDPANAAVLAVLYFADLTELYQVRDEYIRSRPVVSIIMIDNYEELTRNMTEGATSAMNAKLNNAITKWAEDYHGILRRLEKNRFLFVFEKRDLKRAIAEKFSILEDIHEITSPSGLAASISFGLGVDAQTFEEGYEFAALSIEMALSRGGDQAVIKDRLNFTFYGGRTREAEQRSKVRSRVMSNSLMELIGQSSQVFIMGHKNADLDAVGAAMGIACLCRKKGKPFHIVLDMQNNAAQRLVEEICAEPQYANAFISGEEAMVLCDNRSTLVVVDTNRPDQVECLPLLEAVPKVCVVDHHRRAADYIKSVVVNLHEPYASSASELTTELLQYAVEKTDILPIEAKSLMAGIFLDTKSFHVRTGERTFEAAAYLRQLGADTVEVKKLLQNDFKDTIEKFQIIKSAKLYRQQLAIAVLEASTTRALAAQAADELLDISGITASFVLYPDGDRVFISARSIGNANVQVILEPLGGGGNTATAGAQLSGCTVAQALDKLVASIDQFYEE